MFHYYERITTTRQCRRYGFWKFVGDVIMTLLTHGLWLIWIFIREMRGR